MRDTTEQERLLQLKWLFEDHPELVDLMRTADVWVSDDGSMEVRYRGKGTPATEVGLEALAAVLGQEIYELAPGEQLSPSPEGSPTRFGDIWPRAT